jgi:hypothetical protein
VADLPDHHEGRSPEAQWSDSHLAPVGSDS